MNVKRKSKDDLWDPAFGWLLYRDRRLISRRSVAALIFEWKVLLLTRRVGRWERAVEVFLEVIKKTV